MTIWVARAGSNGERENLAIDQSRALIGWENIGDLSKIETKQEIVDLLAADDPFASAGRISNHASQILNFMKSMKVGDLFALPLKTRPAIIFGEVIGEYEYVEDNPPDAVHTRRVKWIREPIPRSKFDQDLLNSFGSALTVFRVNRNNAEERINAIIKGKALPNMGVDTLKEMSNGGEQIEESIDVEKFSETQLQDYIGRKFNGHKMEGLVASILQANGYLVKVNRRKGADGGADILAAKGSMGFESPRLCVQVKSSDTAVGSKDYDELKGVMQKFSADNGLLVSWGGFKSTVEDESRRDFFQIRIWSADDLIKELKKVYLKLPEELQADIPLQQIWALVLET